MDQLALRIQHFYSNVLRHASVDTRPVSLCEIVCEIYVTHPLLTLCSPNSEQTGSFMVGYLIAKLVASSGSGAH
jgi:hypothetical protein